MLDGESQGVEYSIPFDRIRQIEPLTASTTLVTLLNGQKVRLEGSQDVSEKNAGILVMTAGAGTEHYLPWRVIARIEFE
jgi:hypothetical protein